MDFTDADAEEVREFYINAFEETQPINNTLQDVRNAAYDTSSLGKGKDSPRSMIDCSFETEGFNLQIVKKVERMLRENVALQWLTESRPNWSFKMLRSLPGTPAQFWHRDYCYKSRGVNQLYWKGIPLFLMVSFEDDTALDFPSGRVEIPRCEIEVIRGDEMHRGKDNPLSTAQHRLFIALDTAHSESFRKTKEGFDAFDPASESEQIVLDKAFGKSPVTTLKSTPVHRRK
jgi:hypothetical protein